MEEYIRKQISRGYRNKAFIALIICVITLWFIFNSFQAGIFDYKKIIKNDDVEMNLNAQGIKYIKIDTTNLYFTGFYYTLDGRDKAAYYIADLKDRYILVLMPVDAQEKIENYTLKGKLREQDNIDKQVIDELREYYIENHEWEEDTIELEFPKDFIVESLEYESGHLTSFYIQMAGVIILLIFILYCAVFALDPKIHKKYKSLEKYGDIDKVEEDVARDLESDIKYYDTKNLKIMQKYVIERSMFGIKLYRTQDIMWIYKLITTHRTNGIPTGKTYALEIKFSNKADRLGINVRNETVADAQINDFMKKLPNIFYGYSVDLASKYVKDFEGFKKMWQEYKNREDYQEEIYQNDEENIDKEDGIIEENN